MKLNIIFIILRLISSINHNCNKWVIRILLNIINTKNFSFLSIQTLKYNKTVHLNLHEEKKL